MLDLNLECIIRIKIYFWIWIRIRINKQGTIRTVRILRRPDGPYVYLIGSPTNCLKRRRQFLSTSIIEWRFVRFPIPEGWGAVKENSETGSGEGLSGTQRTSAATLTFDFTRTLGRDNFSTESTKKENGSLLPLSHCYLKEMLAVRRIYQL